MKSTIIGLAFAISTVAGAVSAQQIDCSVAANAETDACLGLPTVSSQNREEVLPLIIGGTIASLAVIGLLSGGDGGSSSTTTTN